MYTGGLLVGASSSRVSDNLYNDSGVDEDFVFTQPISPMSPSTLNADTGFQVVFSDIGAGLLGLNIGVKETVLAYSTPADRGYILVEYHITNQVSSLLSNVYAGIFIDWDIRYSWKNRTEYDAANKLGYAYATNGNYYAGIRLLSNYPANFFAFDSDGASGSINLSDGFTSYEKYAALSTPRLNAGFANAAGGDIAHMLSAGPFSLLPYDTLKLAFALVAGDNLMTIRQHANAAFAKYYNLAGEHDISKERRQYFSLQPNPATTETVLRVNEAVNHPFSVILYNSSMVELQRNSFSNASPGRELPIEVSSLSPGLYFLKIHGSFGSELLKLIIVKP
jgi:hypothetical protein